MEQDTEQTILNILLELSNTTSITDWEAQFPFLDHNTVSRVSHSIVDIITRKEKRLLKPVLALTLKWCNVNGGTSTGHSPWMGHLLTLDETLGCTLTSCLPVLQDEDCWRQQDPDQQLALCYALLGAATIEPIALLPECRSLFSILVSRILSLKSLTSQHHRFLAHVWDSRDLLQMRIDVVKDLVKCSPLGLERSVLWIGRSVMQELTTAEDVWNTPSSKSLLHLCSQSPHVFQTVSSILAHMLVVSGGHSYLQEVVHYFIKGVEFNCAKDGCDIIALYADSLQLASALLCIPPTDMPEGEQVEQGDLTKDRVLHIVHALPHTSIALLLSHRPLWLPYFIKEPHSELS